MKLELQSISKPDRTGKLHCFALETNHSMNKFLSCKVKLRYMIFTLLCLRGHNAAEPVDAMRLRDMQLEIYRLEVINMHKLIIYSTTLPC